MALLIRIDVDRPYGRRPLVRHVLSRLSSDVVFPRVEAFGYLKELRQMLQMLNAHKARGHVFFRRCTLPSAAVLALLEQGRHAIGLHLEDSRSFGTFTREKQDLEQHVGRAVRTLSKHGSGGAKYGRRHYAPYEPEKYVQWAQRTSMRVFFGNGEDPTVKPVCVDGSFVHYPGAFWLEPPWRDTNTFSVDWLMARARKEDIVLLVHPENVLENRDLTQDFRRLISSLESKAVDSLFA